MTSSGADVVVFGVGGIGGTVSARLAAFGGLSVACVDKWSAHVAAMTSHGLRYDHTDGSTVRAEVDAVNLEDLPGSGLRDVGLALLCCKSHETADYLTAVERVLAEDGLVVSLQNGLNEIDIARHVGERRTVGGVVLMDGELLGPGHVVARRHPARLDLGSWGGPAEHARRQCERCVGALGRGIDIVNWSQDIRRPLSSKLVKNCVLNAVTAICDYTVAALFRDDELMPIVGGIAGECARVLDAHGFDLDPEIVFGLEPTEQIASDTPEGSRRLWAAGQEQYPPEVMIVSSMLHDVRADRRTEIAAFNGRISALAAGAGLVAPWNDLLVDLIGRIEARRLPFGATGRAVLISAAATVRSPHDGVKPFKP